MQFSTVHLNCLLGSSHLSTCVYFVVLGVTYTYVYAQAAISQGRLEYILCLLFLRLDLGNLCSFYCGCLWRVSERLWGWRPSPFSCLPSIPELQRWHRASGWGEGVKIREPNCGGF